MAKTQTETPMMKQYLEIKEQYPDAFFVLPIRRFL